jgi:dihydroneopterin aldolase
MTTGIIEIRRLEVTAYIGVPAEERAETQELRVTVRMTPAKGFREMDDRIDQTVDYAVVAREIQDLALSRPRHLIETLAADIADHILWSHAVTFVEISLEKFILPETECVAVHLAKGHRQDS